MGILPEGEPLDIFRGDEPVDPRKKSRRSPMCCRPQHIRHFRAARSRDDRVLTTSPVLAEGLRYTTKGGIR